MCKTLKNRCASYASDPAINLSSTISVGRRQEACEREMLRGEVAQRKFPRCFPSAGEDDKSCLVRRELCRTRCVFAVFCRTFQELIRREERLSFGRAVLQARLQLVRCSFILHASFKVGANLIWIKTNEVYSSLRSNWDWCNKDALGTQETQSWQRVAQLWPTGTAGRSNLSPRALAASCQSNPSI